MGLQFPRVRSATLDDIRFLPEIERTAASLFKTCRIDLELSDECWQHVNSVDTFENARRRGHLWVAAAADREIVGFAMVADIAGYAHLEELDVLPAHGRAGVGSALLFTVCSAAHLRRYRGVTLRTFRDVPWNAPFYERRGFKIVDSSMLSPEHLRIESIERERGLRTDLRVTMAYHQGGSGASQRSRRAGA